LLIFFFKVTELEIYNGILANDNANNTSIAFIREIEDFKNKDNDLKNFKNVAKFIELDSKNKIDRTTEKAIDELKTIKIPSALNNDNIYKYMVTISFIFSSNGNNDFLK
jgi:hypothetical protein